MSDVLAIDVDAADVIEAMDGFADAARSYVNAACKVTADGVAREARSRLQRQLKGVSVATKNRPDLGQALTLKGIESRPARDGDGYIVLSGRQPYPALPKWIERGTNKGKPHSHQSAARPYFYASVEVEAEAHYRRIEEALEDATLAQGLGE